MVLASQEMSLSEDSIGDISITPTRCIKIHCRTESLKVGSRLPASVTEASILR